MTSTKLCDVVGANRCFQLDRYINTVYDDHGKSDVENSYWCDTYTCEIFLYFSNQLLLQLKNSEHWNRFKSESNEEIFISQ